MRWLDGVPGEPHRGFGTYLVTRTTAVAHEEVPSLAQAGCRRHLCG